MDYILFCYGLAFIILAAVCVSLQRKRRKREKKGTDLFSRGK